MPHPGESEIIAVMNQIRLMKYPHVHDQPFSVPREMVQVWSAESSTLAARTPDGPGPEPLLDSPFRLVSATLCIEVGSSVWSLEDPGSTLGLERLGPVYGYRGLARPNPRPRGPLSGFLPDAGPMKPVTLLDSSSDISPTSLSDDGAEMMSVSGRSPSSLSETGAEAGL